MLPTTLEALKDQARSVQDEARDIAAQEAEECWQSLLSVARENLGPLWEYVTNTERPRWFPRQGPPWGSQVYTFDIDLPEHRRIHALFARWDWNETKAPECAKWHRSYWPGAPTSDVQRGLATWMVSPPDIPGRIMSYYQTLGAAMVAAEA